MAYGRKFDSYRNSMNLSFVGKLGIDSNFLDDSMKGYRTLRKGYDLFLVREKATFESVPRH